MSLEQKVYLALGSNLETLQSLRNNNQEGENKKEGQGISRKEHLEKAILKLKEILKNLKVSPVYETAALLPSGRVDSSWNLPFLNLVLEGYTELSAIDLLNELKSLEKEAGRVSKRLLWSPRTLDIDLLFFGEEVLQTGELTLPHPRWQDRAFVLDPLKDLKPDPEIIFKARAHSLHQPLWMGVLNITPDSFSKDGHLEETKSSFDFFETKIEAWLKDGIQIFDIGAESTRPRLGKTARPLFLKRISYQEEWRRLKPHLEIMSKKIAEEKVFKPWISVDTNRVEIAERVLALGADIINDVSGQISPAMVEVLKKYPQTQYLLMHSLSIPADPMKVIPQELDVVSEFKIWVELQMKIWQDAGLPLQRLILDPGIGFGKTALQSLELLRRAPEYTKTYPVRFCVGHSRKSFMKNFSSEDPENRDFETMGLSMKLPQLGFDILRVHQPIEQKKAFLAGSHLSL